MFKQSGQNVWPRAGRSSFIARYAQFCLCSRLHGAFDLTPELKWPQRDNDRPHPSVAEVNSVWWLLALPAGL